MKRPWIAGTLACLLAALPATFCAGATYCVDVNWTNNPGAGTTNNPFDTIGAAVAAVNADNGDTILVADGQYKSLANGGKEDFGANGILVTINGNPPPVLTIQGGYAGWDGGSSFDWTNRTPHSSEIDLAGANTRALSLANDWGVLAVDGFAFRNGSATGGGGAVYCAGYNNALRLSDCLFTNNTAVTGNGGAAVACGNLQHGFVIDCDFFGNSASAGSGGAVHFFTDCESGSLISNSVFRGNSCQVSGGGVCFKPGQGTDALNIRNCTFESNQSAANGGAVFTQDGLGNPPTGDLGASLTIAECTFQSNATPKGAAVGGGEEYCQGEYTLQNCLITGNTGGYAVMADAWRVNEPTLEALAEVPFGARLGSSNSHGSPGVSPSSWHCNGLWSNSLRLMEGERPREPKENGSCPGRATSKTSARASLDIAYCTIVGNPGGGVYCYPRDTSTGFRVRDSIVAGNGGTGIYYFQGTFSAAVLQYNDVYGHTVTNYSGDAAAGAGSISLDPLFTNPLIGNYHLTSASPCKDAATNIAVNADLEGALRPQGSGYDMGCYETIMGPLQGGAALLVR